MQWWPHPVILDTSPPMLRNCEQQPSIRGAETAVLYVGMSKECDIQITRHFMWFLLDFDVWGTPTSSR
jgi:hypothetical protein